MHYNIGVLIKKNYIHPLLFVVVLTSACTQPKTPMEVSATFWKSIQARDLNLLYKNVATDSVKKYKLDDMPAVGKVYLGETVVEEDVARVETSIEIKDAGNVQIPAKTFLIMKNGKWKVDFDETVGSVSMNSKIARLFSNMEDAGDEFMKQFNDIITEYQKTIPEVQRGLKKLEDRIKLQIPEIKDRIEEFAREIDKSLKKSPPPPKEPDQPIRI